MNIRQIIREELLKVLPENKAYSSDQITNNELAAYIIILSNNLIAAKSDNNQQLVDSLTKDIEEVKQELSNRKIPRTDEDINVPINVGDEVLGGKFKNKKVKVKAIDTNEKGDITINDKPLLRFRIPKKD